jgi:hypothetical protein
VIVGIVRPHPQYVGTVYIKRGGNREVVANDRVLRMVRRSIQFEIEQIV